MKTWKTFVECLLHALLCLTVVILPSMVEASELTHGDRGISIVQSSQVKTVSRCPGCPLSSRKSSGSMLLPEQHKPEFLHLSVKLLTWDTRVITKRTVINKDPWKATINGLAPGQSIKIQHQLPSARLDSMALDWLNAGDLHQVRRAIVSALHFKTLWRDGNPAIPAPEFDSMGQVGHPAPFEVEGADHVPVHTPIRLLVSSGSSCQKGKGPRKGDHKEGKGDLEARETRQRYTNAVGLDWKMGYPTVTETSSGNTIVRESVRTDHWGQAKEHYRPWAIAENLAATPAHKVEIACEKPELSPYDRTIKSARKMERYWRQKEEADLYGDGQAKIVSMGAFPAGAKIKIVNEDMEKRYEHKHRAAVTVHVTDPEQPLEIRVPAPGHSPTMRMEVSFPNVSGRCRKVKLTHRFKLPAPSECEIKSGTPRFHTLNLDGGDCTIGQGMYVESWPLNPPNAGKF